MANRSARSITTTVLIAVALAAVAIAALRPTAEVTVHDDHVTGIDRATANDALVTSRIEEPGFKLLGITFKSPKYRVQVSFSAPADCLAVIATATTWPTGDPACGPDGGLAGDISGSGRTAQGETIVAVQFAVPASCHDAVAVGEVWGGRPECAASS